MDGGTMTCLLVSLLSCHGLLHGREHVAGTGQEEGLPSSECGKAKPTISTGGRRVQPGEFPWVALLGYRMQDSRRAVPRSGRVVPRSTVPSWRCGGTLITHRHVLTAAHCTDHAALTVTPDGRQTQLVLWAVRLGQVYRNGSEHDRSRPEDFEVEEVVVHSEWSPETMVHDISVVRLKRRVTFTELIRPICLPTAGVADLSLWSIAEEMPTLAGWGVSTSGAREPNNQLMKGRVNFVDKSKCQEELRGRVPGVRAVIDNTMGCASPKRKGSCFGDSGGPLMYYYETPTSGPEGRWYQVGIVSYGPPGCSELGLPSVFTRVPEHMPWILDKIEYR